MLRHKRWAGTVENFPTGGKHVHSEQAPDPSLPRNRIEGPALTFEEGAGSSTDQFDRIALVAEPISSRPPIPASCNIDEAVRHTGVPTTCSASSQCQGNRTCSGGGTCSGHAGAACCAHASPGACLPSDGLCSVCEPGGGHGHTFRIRSKFYPSMYVIPSVLSGGSAEGVHLVFSSTASASGADGSLDGAFTQIEKPDWFGDLAPMRALVPDGAHAHAHVHMHMHMIRPRP